MSEIKTKLLRLSMGELYTGDGEDYIITENHSVSDVIRQCIEWVGIEDVEYLVAQEKKDGE